MVSIPVYSLQADVLCGMSTGYLLDCKLVTLNLYNSSHPFPDYSRNENTAVTLLNDYL